MNIFVLHENPKIAAKYHCDKHVVKMILESTQMLMSSYHLYNNIADDNLYKLTHKNHPCTKWANASLENWKWLYELLKNLHDEWQLRYNHNKQHLAYKKMLNIVNKYGLPKIPSNGLTPFALAMPDQYKSEDVVKSYRDYYRFNKKSIITWKTEIPDWLQ